METTLLLNYGVLGIWTAYMVWKEKTILQEFQRSMQEMNIVLEGIKARLE